MRDLFGGLAGIFRWSRTIFGFVALVLLLLGIFTWLIIGTIIDKDNLTYLIPTILNFSAIIVVSILIIIFLFLAFRPEKLMLGEVSGELYMRFIKLRQGDSDSGEVIEDVIILPSSTDKSAIEACDDQSQARNSTEK